MMFATSEVGPGDARWDIAVARMVSLMINDRSTAIAYFTARIEAISQATRQYEL
jgi:hypothetical protein